MSEHAIYTRYSDNVAKLAEITIAVGVDTGDPNYAPASLVDDRPAKLAKIDSTTGAWLFTFSGAQRIDFLALFHGTFEVGATLQIQGHASADFSSPSFSATIPIQEWLGTGTGRWPQNHWLDLTAQAGYSAAGFQYWRLICSGNAQNVQLGQVVMTAHIRRLDPDVRWGYINRPFKRTIVNETAFGVKTTYSRGTTQFAMEADHPMTDALAADVEAHWYDAEGVSHPWVLVPHGAEPRVYLVRWVEDVFASSHEFLNARDRRFAVEEVARGLRPGV